MTRFVGITIFPEYFQNEGVDGALDNLVRRTGCTAITTSPYVMAPATAADGAREPPADAGAGKVRLLDRPLWGRRELFVRTAPSFVPDARLYRGLRYRAPITTKAYLYLSGTPFKALATGEFIEEQIFNWTYTDEQRAKAKFTAQNPGKWNPYGALPEMRLLTYQMPDELVTIASAGEFDEFDLNEFFAANGAGKDAQFKHMSDVQKWLDIIRGQYAPMTVQNLKMGTRPPFPYSDVRLYLTCNTRSGFCRTSQPVARWRTC